MRNAIFTTLAACLALVACADAGPEPTTTDDARFIELDETFVGGEDEKADMLSKAHILQDVPLGSMIQGTFQPRKRVHGFTFEAKAGAEITVNLKAIAGDSVDVDDGAKLDTVIAVYGPVKGDDKGNRIAAVDDAGSNFQAQLPVLDIQEDGRYLVVFSSWDDPGLTGQYDLGVECDGTNFQCLRPVTDQTCLEGTRFIQGQTVVGDETWSRCNVVLLEETLVEEGSTLTIAPGVTVKGNFLGDAPYGDVALVVDGRLQAIGSESNPVVFTALREGWKGIVLNGTENTLRNVFVDKAAVGVDIVGGNTRIEDATIDHSQLAIRIGEGAAANFIERTTLDAVNNGIVGLSGAEVKVTDTVVRGIGVGVGIQANDMDQGEVRRSVVTGFQVGTRFDDAEFALYDTTIAKNGKGVEITGPDSGVHMDFTCPAMPRATAPSRPRPTPPQVWRRDPAFFSCDIVDNTEQAIHVLAPQLVVVEDSNVQRNGAGIVIESDSLADESRINGSNITDNGESGVQVESWHLNGTLDISGNYWAQISDPELSASWNVTHSQEFPCTLSRTRTSNGCSWNGRVYTCGAWTCDNNNPQRCTAATQTTTRTGEVSFTGFAPEALDAGVNLNDLSDDVNKALKDLGYEGGEPEPEPELLPGAILINEVDYDQPGRDEGEFIELFNAGDTTVPLPGCTVELVNGSNNSVYGRYDLANAGDTLAPGEFLVIGDASVLADLNDDVKRLELTGSIQNGSPDGIRVMLGDVKFDGLAYEGWMPGVSEGDSPADRESNSGLNESLSRCNGDTDDNAKDFSATLPTPGKPNEC